MLHFIKKIIKIEPYKVVCIFNSGEKRIIDLEEKLRNLAILSPELFQPLLERDYFGKVKLDSYGTLYWDNEVDFCPDVLYEISIPA